ncbi:MAG: SDR family oxidoreductase [Propylenella sp.]
MSDTVLLTGISGFLGGHVALALLRAGFRVRGSVRSIAKAGKVRDTLSREAVETGRLEFVELDLTSDRGWPEAVAGCRYVQHVASPFVTSMPKDKNELIRPAVEGTARALSFALAGGVERIVLTSSAVAVNYGHPKARTKQFADADWTVLGRPDVNAYIESKTLAERKAWEIAEQAKRREDLVAINPGILLGPLLDDDPGTSGAIVQRILTGSLRAAPRIAFPVADVRDVAAVHVAAMTSPEAGGHRFLVTADSLSIKQIGDELRAVFPAYRFKLPWFEAPSWLVRMLAPFDADIRGNIEELDRTRHFDSTPARQLLGRDLMPAGQAAREMAQSLIDRGLA